MTNPTAITSTISREHAARLLSVGQRRVRALIAAGVLTVQGRGHASRVTVASVAAELSNREIRKSRQANPGTLGDSRLAVPNFDDCGLDGDADREQNKDEMLVRFPNQAECEPVAELISISRAAALIGVGDDLLRTAAAKGQLPTVQIGKRRRVDVGVLLEWARGTSGRSEER